MKNVLTKYFYRPRYFYKNIPQFFRNIKFAWQRITRGYCDADVWDMNDWFLQVIPSMLEQLADTTHGYPADMEDETAWENYLKTTALHFKSLNYEYNEWENPIPTKREKIKGGFKVIYPDEWKEESEKNRQRILEAQEKAFSMFKEKFLNLWD